jgi:hypothetical protein
MSLKLRSIMAANFAKLGPKNLTIGILGYTGMVFCLNIFPLFIIPYKNIISKERQEEFLLKKN